MVLGVGGGFGAGCLFSQPIHLRPEASADCLNITMNASQGGQLARK